jgi:WD40 repeat protein
VKKIEFTPYGDKFISLNLDGSLFLHSFGIDEDRAALFTYKGQKISDFGQMDNDGTVLAVLSSSNKTLSILDLMTGEILASVKTSANLL